MSDDIVDHLKSLHTRAVDARNGYDEALHDAAGKGLTSLFQELIALHTRNGAELAGSLASAGEVADNNGSFMSTIHRTIMSVRAMFGGLDESVLPGLIDGEQRNVSAIQDALAAPNLTPALRTMLDSQMGRLQAVIARMKAGAIWSP